MRHIQFFLICYSLILALGGMLGFFLSGSFISLVAGFISASLIFVATLLLPYFFQVGKYINYIVLSILAVFFIFRWIVVGSFIPAGIMTILTVITFAYLLHFLERKKS